MKKVLRYELDDFLQCIFEKGVVRDNSTDDYISCEYVVKMSDGLYRILIDNYLVQSYLIDDEIVAFPEDAIYLDNTCNNVELACIVFNQRQFDENPNGDFIDEIYIIDGVVDCPMPTTQEPDRPIMGPVYDPSLSKMEQIEMLLENYNNDFGI